MSSVSQVRLKTYENGPLQPSPEMEPVRESKWSCCLPKNWKCCTKTPKPRKKHSRILTSIELDAIRKQIIQENARIRHVLERTNTDGKFILPERKG